MRERKLTLLVHHPCEAKVPQLHIAVAIQKDVARLQVSVQNLLRVLTFFQLFFIYAIVDLGGLSPSVTVVQG